MRAAWTMYGANLAFVAEALAVLAASGWWAVAPFRRHFAYPLASAPLAGMVLVSVGSLAVTVAFGIELRWTAPATIAVFIAASLLSVFLARETPTQELPFTLALMGALAGAAVWFCTRTDLFFGSPGFVYAHGTDHLGYAHIADWLRQRPGNLGATPNPEDWYGSWPHLMYTQDPRFGSFALLALVSIFSRRSAAFAFDLGSAVILAAASVGVAAVFARRRATLVVLTVGLFTSFWFDWNRAGYLGKATAYPATILVVGLFFAWVHAARRDGEGRLFTLAALAALTAGTAIMFSGLVTAMFLALFGLALFVALRLGPRSAGASSGTGGLADPAVVLALLVALSILSSGIVARPLYFLGRTPLPWSWSEVLFRAVELEGLAPGRTVLSDDAIRAASFGLLAAWAGLTVVAVFRGIPTAVAVLTAPLVLLVGLVAADLRWQAMNFTGMFVPMLLCGAAAVRDTIAGSKRPGWLSITALGVLVACAAIHLPRFAATASLHGGRDTPPLFRFSARETDGLAAAIRQEGGTALVDAAGAPHFAIFLMVELGRRRIPLQWTEQTWRLILGYRPWPVPTYRARAPLRIVTRTGEKREGSTTVFRTTQFELLREP